MRKPLLLVLSLLASVSLGAALSGPASASSFKPCAGTFAPNGTPGGGFYRRIRAKGVTCSTAKSVTHAWVKAEAPGTRDPTSKITILGYSCKGHAVKSAPHDLEGGLSVLCIKGTKAVSFYGHP